MRRILPATLIGAVLAFGAFSAVAANAALPALNSPTILAAPPASPATATPEPPAPAGTEAAEPAGTEAAEPAEVPGAPDVGHADDPADPNADHQFEGEE